MYEDAKNLNAHSFVLTEVWEGNYLTLITGDSVAAQECYDDCDPATRKMIRTQYVRVGEVPETISPPRCTASSVFPRMECSLIMGHQGVHRDSFGKLFTTSESGYARPVT